MAVRNDPRMYSAGAVVVDSSPSTQLYARVMERKQAKKDAMDEYDRNRLLSVNPQGLRDVDREGFDRRLTEAKTFHIQNKGQIRKGNTPEALEYEKRLREVKMYIDQSKERTAKQEAGIKFYNDKLKQDGVIPDEYIQDIHTNDMPIDSEGSQSFDLTKWLTIPKPHNQKEYLRLFSDIKRKPGAARYEPIEGQPLSQTQVVEERFDQGTKDVIAARAADRYDNSNSFREAIKTEMKDPSRVAAMSKVLKDEYGIDASLPEHFAIAYTMEQLQPVVVKSKTVPNVDAKMTRQEEFRKYMNGVQFGQQKELIALRAAYGDMSYEKRQAAVSGDVETYLNEQEASATEVTTGLPWNRTTAKEVKASPILLESFKDNLGVAPERILILPNGNRILQGKDYKTTEITRAEYKASIVNKFLNTNVKIGQTKPATQKPPNKTPKPVIKRGVLD